MIHAFGKFFIWHICLLPVLETFDFIFQKPSTNIKHDQAMYGKCPKILYTKVPNKMACANSADPDQTAPEGAVWSESTMFAIPLHILRNNSLKSKI